jgi:hypothetical protein
MKTEIATQKWKTGWISYLTTLNLLLEDLDIFKEFMVVTDRFNGFKPHPH